jgi:glycosyltransferase involved in cell wall biosynthesis
MRLLYLNHNYRYGGTYYRAMPMAEALVKLGHEVTLFTVSPVNKWKTTWFMVNGVSLCESPNLGQNSSGEGYGPLDNLVRIVYSLFHRFDIVHMFDHKPNATFGGYAKKFQKTTLVADWADWWGGPGGMNDVPKRRHPVVGRFEERWEIKSKLWADGITVISRVLRERALTLGCDPNRILHLPTGAPLDRIQPIPKEQARRRLGIPMDRKIVGFIGMGQGDLEIVMHGLKALPGVWLMVIGQTNARVLDLASSFGIAGRLWQPGFVPDDLVSYYLGCIDVACLPMTDRAANRGRFPNKLLDYMASGRPMVCSPVGDVKEILEKHKCGLLAADHEFAGTLQDLLGNLQLQKDLEKRARNVASTFFNWSMLAGQLEGFYQNLVERRRPHR